MSLPDSFESALWRGTTSGRGADVVGVSFDLESGAIVRLALPADSARQLMASLRDYLETGVQSCSESGSPIAEVSGQRE